jgi:glucan biosynthesis protein C
MKTYQEEKTRQHYLDWVRVFAFTLLICSHASNIFTNDNNYIVNDEKSQILDLFFQFTRVWRIPLLFFISGAVINYSISSKTIKEYLGVRFQRLLLPLIFTTLVIIPPMFFIRAHFKNETGFSLYNYYYDLFTTGHITWQHMWYVAYILFYSIVTIPLFFTIKNNSKVSIEKVMNKLNLSLSIVLLLIPLLLTEYFLSPFFPFTHQLWNDWYYIAFSLALFIYGFVLNNSNTFMEYVVRNRIRLLIISFIALVIGYWLDRNNSVTNFSVLYFIVKTCKPTASLLIILSIMGFARKYFNFKSDRIMYANQAIYPVYILHNTVLLSIGYFIIQLNFPIFIKYLLIVLFTFAICIFIYDFLVKKYNLTRVLFGLKPKNLLNTKKTSEIITTK